MRRPTHVLLSSGARSAVHFGACMRDGPRKKKEKARPNSHVSSNQSSGSYMPRKLRAEAKREGDLDTCRSTCTCRLHVHVDLLHVSAAEEATSVASNCKSQEMTTVMHDDARNYNVDLLSLSTLARV